jgi:hypothetical protein
MASIILLTEPSTLIAALHTISSNSDLCLRISDWYSENSELSETQLPPNVNPALPNELKGPFLQVLHRISLGLCFWQNKQLMECFIATLDALPPDLHLHLLPADLATELHEKLSLAKNESLLKLPTTEQEIKLVADKTTRLLGMFSQNLRKILDPIILDVVASAFPSVDPQQVLHSIDIYRFWKEWLPVESPGRWKVLHPNSLCLQFSELHLTSIFFQTWDEELKPCLCAACRNGERRPEEKMHGHYPIALPVVGPSALSLLDTSAVQQCWETQQTEWASK